MLARNYPPEQSPYDQEPRRIDALIDQVKTMGSVKLREVSETERQQLFEWYVNHFDAIDKNDKVDFLEEFLMEGLIDDDQAVSFVRQMEDPEVKKIGEYLVSAIDPSPRYTRTFHECWWLVSDKKQKAFIADVINNHPEGIILIAPFIDLARTRSKKEKKYSSEDQKYDSQLDIISEEADTILPLIDACLRFLEEHPDLAEHDNARAETKRKQEWRGYHNYRYTNDPEGRVKTHVRDLINSIRNTSAGSTLLGPYLRRIKDLHLLSEKEWNSVALSEPVWCKSFHTKVEQARMDEINKQLISRDPTDTAEDISYKHYLELSPRPLATERQQIEMRGRERWLHLLHQRFLEERDEIPMTASEWMSKGWKEQYPMGLVLKDMHLSKEEVRIILNEDNDREGGFFRHLLGPNHFLHCIQGWFDDWRFSRDLHGSTDILQAIAGVQG